MITDIISACANNVYQACYKAHGHVLSYCACVDILAGNAAKARSITSSTLKEIMETQERHCRVKAMKVFRKKTYSLRQELQMETDALNSMLFSKGLISEAVLAKNSRRYSVSHQTWVLNDETRNGTQERNKEWNEEFFLEHSAHAHAWRM